MVRFAAKNNHDRFWEARSGRQREVDACIAARAEYEPLYDKPYEDRGKTRVAGPFTVESLSPHRIAALDENDELIAAEAGTAWAADVPRQDFAHMILENLRAAGVQQASKADRITFSSLEPWPGDLVCAEGRYLEGDDGGREQRAGIFIGPEFGTVSRNDLVRATLEAAEANFDSLIACAFNYEAHATEFNKLGRIPVLKARMNADLHMAEDLKKTDTANLFVIFGEPDIDIEPATLATTAIRTGSASGSSAWTYSTPRRAKSAATAPKGSPAGSSTPTTARRASSSARPTSSARATPTSPSRPR